MSLPVLVVLVAFGIALSVAAVHFTGGTTTATLADADQALARFAEDFPDERPGAVRLTADDHAAFLDLGPRRCGIVQSIGDCFLTRIVSPYDVLALAREGNVVSLRLNDFTWIGGRFVFADEADALAIAAALEGRDQIRKAA
ncbi:hypothetical protein EN828_17550 [Mesorhizobium sp. M2D.F.Ca.ET.185.01.1.1]|uniref:hypothetical protein n=1 Tax=unclassified Mesorhizobium TaxID=325217 RepID=UPI000FCBA329|nr:MULTISPECIES: hypothetical protein [unclassified Mesorhizobium]TGP79249.1 hypothetical protein EN870_13875 [bacterium M00.F.Ca.ET.227.01.1.1]TGQ01014.1 hypothetical protein EN864_03365 [bacterium M00.F.Ca.ET.221.01.1.1]TGQ02467.1 hypothetical protein EN865_00540 [bacterium M00.F.Ca.ET.222.01.1.1]TGU12364.1 hypothetical protein EN806_18310 [bacterium M00.F.Ca.ET.163.01.1.1]TGU34334.1 hypothetical protein EN799_20435 [bacterium M00.F.Ca.ET.156.01.1.1]TGU46296.1 hypothetical protein EN789_151